MNSSKSTAGLVAIALFGLGIAGCGSDSDSGGSGGKLDKKALASKLNSICGPAEKKVNAIKEPSNIQDPKAAGDYFGQVAPILDQATSDMKKLTPADDVKADFDAFIKAETDANDLLQSVTAKAKKADASGLQDLAKLSPLGDKVTSTAKALGANDCA